MTLKKKIFGSIFILACLGLIVGGYLWWNKSKQKEISEKMPEIPEIDLSFSPLEKAELPEINLNLPLDFSSFNLNLPDLSGEKIVGEVKKPNIDFNISGLGSEINFGGANKTNGNIPPSNWEPDESTCSQFKAAPSCSFVPEQYRDLCEKCKAKNY